MGSQSQSTDRQAGTSSYVCDVTPTAGPVEVHGDGVCLTGGGNVERASLLGWPTDTLNVLWPNLKLSSQNPFLPLYSQSRAMPPHLPSCYPKSGKNASRAWESCVDMVCHSPSPSVPASVGLFKDCHPITCFWTRGLNKWRDTTKMSRWHQNVTFPSERGSVDDMALCGPCRFANTEPHNLLELPSHSSQAGHLHGLPAQEGMGSREAVVSEDRLMPKGEGLS